MVSSSLRSILSGCNDYMQGGADPGSILYRSHPGIRTTSVLRLDLQLSDFRGEGSPHVRGVGIPCSRVTSTNRQSSSSFTHRQSPTNLESVWVRRSSSTHSTYENKNSCYLLSLHSDVLDGRGGVEGRRYDVGTIGHNGQHKHLTRGCHLEPTTCPPTLLTTPAAPYQLTPLASATIRTVT